MRRLNLCKCSISSTSTSAQLKLSFCESSCVWRPPYTNTDDIKQAPTIFPKCKSTGTKRFTCNAGKSWKRGFTSAPAPGRT